MTTPTRPEIFTVSNHPLDEVVSAFQKAIRRSDEDEALHWGIELDLSGYGEYAFKRMKIMVSEDIGLAEPSLPANIHALYETWSALRKKKDFHKPERLMFTHAILLMARAQKSRIVDHALICHYKNHVKREVPDYAVDKHTRRGKSMGRGFDHFFDEGIKLVNESDLVDEYQAEARRILTEPNAGQPEPVRGQDEMSFASEEPDGIGLRCKGSDADDPEPLLFI